MPTVMFLGRVLPPAMVFNTKHLPQIKWKNPELGLDMLFTVQVENSHVKVACDLNKWNKADHLVAVYMPALDIARAVVDLCSFQSGIGMTVVLETLIDGGVDSLLLMQQPTLGLISTSIQTPTPPTTLEENHFDKVLRLVLTDVSLFRALHDLIEAITQTHVAPMACGRAMEGLRHIIAPSLERKKGWPKVNETLRLDRSYLDLILDTSKGPRHADPTYIDGAKCVEITTRAWVVMNRFFEYLKRGRQPLPESEFPTLR